MDTRIRTLFLVVPHIILLALAGCASTQASTRDEAGTTGSTTQQQGMQAMEGMCPMGVRDTKVEASDTENGAALTFTTTGDVAELRRRVAAMAERHNARPSGPGMAGCTCPHYQKHGTGGPGMKMGMRMPASRATTEEVPGGVRLVLTPVDATQLDALRQSVRHHAEMMGSGQCPMMQAPPAHGG